MDFIETKVYAIVHIDDAQLMNLRCFRFKVLPPSRENYEVGTYFIAWSDWV